MDTKDGQVVKWVVRMRWWMDMWTDGGRAGGWMDESEMQLEA